MRLLWSVDKSRHRVKWKCYMNKAEKIIQWKRNARTVLQTEDHTRKTHTFIRTHIRKGSTDSPFMCKRIAQIFLLENKDCLIYAVREDPEPLPLHCKGHAADRDTLFSAFEKAVRSNLMLQACELANCATLKCQKKYVGNHFKILRRNCQGFFCALSSLRFHKGVPGAEISVAAQLYDQNGQLPGMQRAFWIIVMNFRFFFLPFFSGEGGGREYVQTATQTRCINYLALRVHVSNTLGSSTESAVMEDANGRDDRLR